MVDMNQMLSANFSLKEMCHTSKPFPNIPTDAEVAKLKVLCQRVLEPIRAHFKKPIKVNSGYRGKKVNDAVGSSDSSQHRLGEAADIEIVGVTNGDLAKYIRDNLDFDQVILEAYHIGNPSSGWVHVSYREGRLRKNALTMTMGTHGPVYTAGIHV